MKRQNLRPQRPARPALRRRLLTLLSASISTFALMASGELAADQPPKIRPCNVAAVVNDLLTVNCPKGRLGELLTALHNRTGMESDVSAELADAPVSVVLDKASLQAALDVILASYNYSLEGAPAIVGGRANGSKVVVLGRRETAADDKNIPTPKDGPTATREPTPPPYQEEAPPAPETASNDSTRPNASDPTASEAATLAPGMPTQDPAAVAKAREAFFANLPAPSATLPPAAAQAQLPPSPRIENSTGPGDGRQGLPLPEFTPGAPSRTPPFINQ